MVRFLHIDPTINGSNPPSAKLFFRVRRVALAVCNSICRNQEVCCSIRKKLLNVKISTYESMIENESKI